MRDKCSTLAVAPEGGKCRVSLVTKTIVVVTSDSWLLKVGVKFEISGKQNKMIYYLLLVLTL